MNAGYAKSIEGGCAVVEEQDVRAVVFAVARIDSFVLAIVNPEPIKNNRHAGKSSCGTEFVASGTPSAIHGNAGERPLFRSGS